MGAPKKKWTSEEEDALRAGIEMHEAGKWRTIQKDPEFSQCLAHRSNIDLKQETDHPKMPVAKIDVHYPQYKDRVYNFCPLGFYFQPQPSGWR